MDVVTSCERPDLEDEAGAAFKVKWPEFIFHDPIAKQYVSQVAQCFPQYDVLLLDEGRVVAGGWGVPIGWDGTVEDLPDGYDGAMVRAVEGHQSGVQATTFSFMAVAVGNGETKRGLAGEVMTALRLRAAQAGLAHVIAPLRPTLKPKYPLVPMASFATWTRPDGLSIDPWIRAHQRMGAVVLAPCARSMVMTGPVPCVSRGSFYGHRDWLQERPSAIGVRSHMASASVNRRRPPGDAERKCVWLG